MLSDECEQYWTGRRGLRERESTLNELDQYNNTSLPAPSSQPLSGASKKRERRNAPGQALSGKT